MIISGLRHPRLTIASFCPVKGESWCLYGSNKSGINEFLELLSGNFTPEIINELRLPSSPAVISFRIQQDIFEEELKKDDTDFMDRIDPGTPARAFLPRERLDDPLIDRFHMRPVLDNGYRQLSSGQARKLLILEALLKGCSCLILDSPYDGLDRESCRELDRVPHRTGSPESPPSCSRPQPGRHSGMVQSSRRVFRRRDAGIWKNGRDFSQAYRHCRKRRKIICRQ